MQGKHDWQPVRAAIALTVTFNLFTLLVFTVSGYFRGPESFRESLILGVPMMAIDGFLGFQLYHVLRLTSAWRPVPRWGSVTIAVITIALVQAFFDTELRVWAQTMTMDYRQAYIRATTLNTYNSGMLAALLAFQSAFMALRHNQHLLEETRQREREAQMLALRFQLNPHFLFNTLNAISSLVVLGRTRDAEAMIDRLSTFLRGSLSADPERMVTVEEEFEMLETYLEIESVRFGDRLISAINLPQHLARMLMPPFLLQPLVENAVKYAVAPSRTPVKVDIVARERDGRLELEVIDSGGDGVGASAGTGVGIANVRERLRLSYGTEGRIEIGAGEAGGFRVTLAMPQQCAEPSDQPTMTIAA